jgi:hypothetical protein
MCVQRKKPEVSSMFLRGDIQVLVPALLKKFWLYIPRRLYIVHVVSCLIIGNICILLLLLLYYSRKTFFGWVPPESAPLVILSKWLPNQISPPFL